MIFTASMDKQVRRRTIVMSAVLFALPLFSLFRSSGEGYISVIIFFLYLLSLVLAYAQMPRVYRLDNEELVIQRLFSNIVIRKDDIRQVEAVNGNLMEGTWGGAFGYSGVYETILGDIRFYTLRSDKLVLITKTDGTKIMLSPDHPDQFLGALKGSVIHKAVTA